MGSGGLYQLNIRCGKRVRSVYLNGEEATRIAEQVAVRKEDRKRVSAHLARLKAEAGSLDTQNHQLDQVSKTLVAATLIGAGLHEHRGSWRRPQRAHGK